MMSFEQDDSMDVPTDDSMLVEDLTVAEALGQFWRAPISTVRAVRRVATTPARKVVAPERLAADRARPAPVAAAAAPVRVGRLLESGDSRAARQLGLRLVALILAWWGSGILANTPQRTEATALVAGAPFLILGFVIWLGAELYGDWPAIQRWQARRRDGGTASGDDEPDDAKPKQRREMWTGLHPLKAFAGLGGLFFSVIAVRFTADNFFTMIGFWAWVASILLWMVALSPAGDGPYDWVKRLVGRLRRQQWRHWTVFALLFVLLLGAVFRLDRLSDVAPEMTSDHVEKILDARDVLNGDRDIFFANNGGREPFQMYAMALLSLVPGLGLNFTTLKLLSALEGLASILLMYWMGREIVGEGDRRLGALVGVVLAALVAASYWHTGLSRLGLRIILTTGVTAALLVFLARAMRHNRRGDFVKAGLVLGLGLYMYQAVRMLPVVIIVGVGMAFFFKARGWRDHGRYILNFVVLVVIAFVIFLPMFGYSLQFPEDFWRRTSGRLLGDDVITTTDEAGNIVEREPTLTERIEAFNDNLPILASNVRNALLMFNWKGDVAWINGAPNQPAMDMFTGAFLIVGLAAWLARMVRRRDVFDWLVPLALVIMLLPSALSIAYPVENPSHTRTSGALPEAYLIAALPLALLVQSILQLVRGRRGVIAAVVLVVLVALGAYNINQRFYFDEHYDAYVDSSYPYSEAGRVLRGFAESDGSYGNAFMLAYPFWWDHRALAIEAGEPAWPHGVVSAVGLRDVLFLAYDRDDEFQLDADKDLLFFLAAEDDETLGILQTEFPQGRLTLRQSYQPDDQYRLYRVPAMGAEDFLTWVADN